MVEFEEVFAKKNAFFICTTLKAPFYLCRLQQKFWKWPEQGATPGQTFHGTNHLARLPRFQVPGVFGSKVILLRKMTKIFQYIFFVFGQQKVEIRAHNQNSKGMEVEIP